MRILGMIQKYRDWLFYGLVALFLLSMVGLVWFASAAQGEAYALMLL
jgi:hypothetical protein